MSAPTVIIKGAGPGGLLLARYSELKGVPVEIYEKKLSATAREQGGSLDLHGDTGLLTLKQTVLESAQRLIRSEGEALRILDSTGKVWYDEAPAEYCGQQESAARCQDEVICGRPEIDRLVSAAGARDGGLFRYSGTEE